MSCGPLRLPESWQASYLLRMSTAVIASDYTLSSLVFVVPF